MKEPAVQELSPEASRQSLRARAGAAGKALIVYLGSGSVLLAVIAYLIFAGMGY